MIRIGIVGAGDMGRLHARMFAAVRGAKIVAASDPSDDALKTFATTVPDARLFSDHRTMLKQARLDAAVICVPTLYHTPIGIDCMKAGLPIMIEKPLARTVADGRRLVDTAEKTGKLLMVAHVRRYDKDWDTFARIVRSGEIGRPVLWRSLSGWQGPGRWFMDDKIGGGPLMDGAVHNYDFANMLFGDPESVVARQIKLTGSSAIDTATAVIRYKSGDQLMMSWSWGIAASAGASDILGPKGSILFGDGGMPHPDKPGYSCYCVCPMKEKRRLIRFKYNIEESFIAQARHFIACVEGKTKTLSPGLEALKGVAVAEAVLKAARKDGKCKVIVI